MGNTVRKATTSSPVKKTASPSPAKQPEAKPEAKDETKPEASDSPTTDSHTTEADPAVEQAEANGLKVVDLHYTGEPKTEDQDFTYPTHTDPARQLISTSNYLDDVQRHDAEVLRAKLEDREPDLKNAPATQGTPLLPSYVVQANVPGDHIVESDVTLPVTIGRNEVEAETAKIEAVPTYSVSKKDLDKQGRVSV